MEYFHIYLILYIYHIYYIYTYIYIYREIISWFCQIPVYKYDSELRLTRADIKKNSNYIQTHKKRKNSSPDVKLPSLPYLSPIGQGHKQF